MQISHVGSRPSKTDRWKNVAEQIANFIQNSAIEVFRQAIRQVTCDWLKVNEERENREEKRREILRKSGIVYLEGKAPDPDTGGMFFHIESIKGIARLPSKTKLPPSQPLRPEPPACLRDGKLRDNWNTTEKNEVLKFQKEQANHNKEMQAHWPKWRQATLSLFGQLKKLGFPNEKNGIGCSFDVCCWIPEDLEPDKDRWNDDLLPVPHRELSDAERKTILAAVYDAHWCGGEKVAPFGVSGHGSIPSLSLTDAVQDEKRAALAYFLLFQKAQQLDDSSADLSVIESWLKELTAATEMKTPGLRVQVIAESMVIQIDGIPYPLSGSDIMKERLIALIQTLIDAKGAPLPAMDHGIRTRDVERSMRKSDL